MISTRIVIPRIEFKCYSFPVTDFRVCHYIAASVLEKIQSRNIYRAIKNLLYNTGLKRQRDEFTTRPR